MAKPIQTKPPIQTLRTLLEDALQAPVEIRNEKDGSTNLVISELNPKGMADALNQALQLTADKGKGSINRMFAKNVKAFVAGERPGEPGKEEISLTGDRALETVKIIKKNPELFKKITELAPPNGLGLELKNLEAQTQKVEAESKKLVEKLGVNKDASAAKDDFFDQPLQTTREPREPIKPLDLGPAINPINTGPSKAEIDAEMRTGLREKLAETQARVQGANEAVNVMQLRNQMDANKDGKISSKEMTANLDRNRDGIISAEEVRNNKDWDINKDGQINRADMVKIAEKLQGALDPKAQAMLTQMTNVDYSAKSPAAAAGEGQNTGKNR